MSADGLYCQPPQLDWSQASGPRAPDYGDIYFSAEDGLEESRAVFLKGCDLPQDWQGKTQYVVGELGFGTGLNALALWDLWRREGPAKGWLHFVSIEKHPLRREDAARAFAAWPSLAGLSAQLLAQWPSALKGAHRLIFPDDRFTITLFQDEAELALAQIEARVDAWFLDGFAPARNEAMWSQAVFDRMGRLSRAGSRVATFTVAGAVRRGLQQAGFSVAKRPGFGRKRERLEAIYAGAATPPDISPVERTRPCSGRVAIIGAGIAGASLALAFRRRGREVVVVDAIGAAGGASGAPVGLLTPRLERTDRPHVRATLAAFEFARLTYAGLDGFYPEGVLRLPRDAEDRDRLALIASRMDAEHIWDGEGLWQPRAARFEPRRLVQGLLADTPVVIAQIARVEESETSVRLLDDGGHVVLEADLVIHASGWGAHTVFDALDANSGQLAVLAGTAPQRAVVWGGYACAAPGGGVMLGTTHVRGEDAGLVEDAIEGLRADLAIHRPEIAAGLGADVLQTWSGVRAVTSDQLPVSGPLAGSEFTARWRQYSTGRMPRIKPGPPGPCRQFILSGFGSRGFAHAPLLAEALASDLSGEPGAFERAGRECLQSTRFAWRRLKRSH
ncbi:tRNA (5-methylaminomethyl-2-thiouridine)(34)-methyltransferase MnmD [Maricaulis salignorans]|uniref:tRNA 5-methylaminomethyl-2-thiouridine biosynthesis bifunctional protein MnmC n=1 Tax=Maricaulis salignorans TaxID=144026 RepID=A0A1G9QLH4_9PROT|nr:tRNA (5-methylaminomethyl-2-thiouridine)(34)-methyltransferase MnmD [Maricaulis salignorans]SDM11681.1 tRNA 5-methylaminomethyl-2-thiouridine biosynthesis bifunctional protein [Maricaulis salignorans]